MGGEVHAAGHSPTSAVTGHAQVRADVVDDWPALRVEDWTATRDILHMWTQIVGKLRLASAPMVNHWWQVPLYVTARGLILQP
jgi:hypothetical protein